MTRSIRYPLAWWLTILKTLVLLLCVWLMYDWVSRPDPWAYFESRSRRNQTFLVFTPVLGFAALLETQWAWMGSAIVVKPRQRMLWCRKHLGFSRTIPFQAIHGLRVHRHHLEYGVTIISPADVPIIPIRLPRGTDPAEVERELRRAVGLDR